MSPTGLSEAHPFDRLSDELLISVFQAVAKLRDAEIEHSPTAISPLMTVSKRWNVSQVSTDWCFDELTLS
jgi:hypothetical protein